MASQTRGLVALALMELDGQSPSEVALRGTILPALRTLDGTRYRRDELAGLRLADVALLWPHGERNSDSDPVVLAALDRSGNGSVPRLPAIHAVGPGPAVAWAAGLEHALAANRLVRTFANDLWLFDSAGELQQAWWSVQSVDVRTPATGCTPPPISLAVAGRRRRR